MKRMCAVAVIISLAVLLVGCEGHKDVTKDPRYGFGGVAGSTWKLKVPLALQGKDQWTATICAEEYAAQFAAGSADREKFGNQEELIVTGIMPSGTTISFKRLETGGSTMGGVLVYFSGEAGEFKGKIILAPKTFFLPNEFNSSGESYGKTWAVNPEFLAKP